MKPYGIMMSQVPSQQECTEIKKPCTALTDESSPHFISGVVCREKTKQGPNSIEKKFVLSFGLKNHLLEIPYTKKMLKNG